MKSSPMAAKRKPPETMSLVALFVSDLRPWKNTQYQESFNQVLFQEALPLIWHHAGVRATFIYRLNHWCHRHRIRIIPSKLRGMNIRRFGLDSILSISIGSGLYIPHPVGTIVVARGLGRNVRLIADITMSMVNTHVFPLIGNHVTIGAGARVLGGIVVGDDATVGANAAVIDDVPPGATIVGIPTRPTKPREERYIKQTMEIFYGSY